MLFKKKKLIEARECFTRALTINSVNESAINGLTSVQLVSLFRMPYYDTYTFNIHGVFLIDICCSRVQCNCN
jgi:hypothetical protein